MTFNFDWNFVSSGAPYITISNLGLAFNASAIKMLGNPENVAIGFDEEHMCIGVKAISGNSDVKSYKFRDRIRNGWVRIGCRDFVKYLAAISGLTFAPAMKYVATMDESNTILYILINRKEAETD